MATKKRKYTRREKVIEEPVQEIPEVVEDPVILEEEKPAEPQVLCDCGKPANPGSHQCWGCSHRT